MYSLEVGAAGSFANFGAARKSRCFYLAGFEKQRKAKLNKNRLLLFSFDLPFLAL